MKEIRCHREAWRDSVELAVFLKSANGVSVAAPLTMVPFEEGCYLADPTMRMTTEEAQMLIDELWRCGLRPSEGTGSAGSLAATERHLKDMQRITFDLMGKFVEKTE